MYTYGDHPTPSIKTGNAHKERTLTKTTNVSFKKCEGEELKSQMVVVFTITEVNYLMVSHILRFGTVPFLFVVVVFSSLAALFALFPHSDKTGYGFLKFIYHNLVGAHHTKLFSNKIFSLNSILQIVMFTALL